MDIEKIRKGEIKNLNGDDFPDLSVKVKGKKVYDPLSRTAVWSENPSEKTRMKRKRRGTN